MEINQDNNANLYELKTREALSIKPDDITLQYELSKILLEKKENKDEAKEILENLLDTNLRNKVLFQLGKLEMEDGNVISARYYFKNLLKTKNRSVTLFELGKLEKFSDNCEQSKNYFRQFLNERDSSSNKVKEFYALQYLLFLEIHDENYEEAYIIFQKILEHSEVKKISHKNLVQINLYLKYKLERLNEEDKEEMKNSYFFNQLQNYDEKRAIDHIKNHLDENNTKREHTIFLNSISIKKLYNEISLIIKILKPKTFNLCDKYILDYEYAIGEINGVKTNTIEIITFPNTNDIITMYPIISKEQDFIIPKTKKLKNK